MKPTIRTATPADLIERQKQEALVEMVRAETDLGQKIEALHKMTERVRGLYARDEIDGPMVVDLEAARDLAASTADAARVAIAARARADRAGHRR